MNTSELESRLLAEGCNPDNFCIGPCRTASDIFCLSESAGKWSIYYTERGRKSKPLYESRDEAEACERYYQQIMAIEHWHLVDTFESDEPAWALQTKLEAAGIRTIRNDMPPLTAGGPDIARVFVAGKDIFKVRSMDRC